MNEQTMFHDTTIEPEYTQPGYYNWITNYTYNNLTDARFYFGMNSFIAGLKKISNQINDSNTTALLNLFHNYPDLLTPTTAKTFHLSEDSKAVLKRSDLLGREVRYLIDVTKKMGTYNIIWNGEKNFKTQVLSEMYLYQLDIRRYLNLI